MRFFHVYLYIQNILKPGSNEDESQWELACESLHECFLNSHCSVKRAVRVAWELTRVFLLFSIFSFLLVASTLLFLRFLMLVKLLTDFLIIIIMGNDMDIACFWFILSVRKPLRNISHFVESGTAKWKPLAIYNSHWLSCNSHDRSNEPNLSLTLIKIWTSSNLMRVDESWRSNESESCDSHPLSSSFNQDLTVI